MVYAVEWSWLTSTALFFGGLAGGSYLWAFGAGLSNEKKYANFSKVGYSIAFPAVLAYLIFLVLELGTPTNFIKIRNLTSMIFVGASIVSLFFIFSLLTLIGREPTILPQISFNQKTQRILEGIGSIFAFGIIMYTALLLGASFGRPFWGSPFLPYLFLVSGLLTGWAVISLVLLSREDWRKPVPDFLDLFVLLITLLFVLSVLDLATVVAPESIAALITGNLNVFFIVGVLIVGIFIPFILAYYSMSKKEVPYFISGITFILVLIGGFLLRYVIVVGGQVPPVI